MSGCGVHVVARHQTFTCVMCVFGVGGWGGWVEGFLSFLL